MGMMECLAHRYNLTKKEDKNKEKKISEEKNTNKH